MNITKILQSSIDYMEANLRKEINYEDVARQVHMSNYHFQRLFSMIVGLSPNEYIRSRRLSLAGEEVILSDRKVIDIALDYGYSTPESFTKAFSRFHGITPMMARRAGGSLNMFNPLQIKITLEGGTKMDYRIERREPFKMVAKVRAFNNEIISQEDNHEIPDFWKAFSEESGFEELASCGQPGGVYGVCGPVDEESKTFRYGIAMAYSQGDIPNGYEVWNVEPNVWAVFRCIGETPDCIGDTWNRIFTEFLPSSDYEMLDDTDFEYYPNEPEEGVFCEIWVPVGK